MTKAGMTKAGMTKAGTGRPHPDLVALLRFLVRLKSPVLTGVEADRVTIGDENGGSRIFHAAVLRQAAALGLVARDGQSLRVMPAASAFLRRMMADTDSAFQDQHRDLEDVTLDMDDGRQSVRRNHAESPLGSVARLKDRNGAAFLCPDALCAGERLHADFTRAQLQPRLTMQYEPQVSSRTKGQAGRMRDLSDSALSARTRVTKALEAVGPELSGVVLDVCCFQKGLEVVERERQWPVRSAKLLLRVALMALARHYAPPVKSAGRGSHAWGDDGYRPQMNAAGGTPTERKV